MPTLSEVISLVSIVIAALATFVALRKSKPEANKASAEARKANADADNTITATATETVALIKELHEARIARLEKQAAEDKQEREGYEEMVRELNGRLGEIRQAAEIHSREISLLRNRVEELLAILREAGVQWPAWAGSKNGK